MNIIGWIVAVGLSGLQSEDVMAQDTIRVGQGRADGSFIEDISVVWLGTPTKMGGTVGASFTVEELYEVIGTGDNALLKMTQVWNDTLGEPIFTTVRVSKRKTMEYLAFHTGGSPQGFGHLDFDDGFVTGMYAPAPEQRIRRYALQLEERPFASMSGIMLASFPLEDGAAFVYPGFGWGGMTNPRMHWRQVEVVGRDHVEIPDRGRMLAWKVQSGNVTYWLSRETPYFLKAETAGANGQGTTFEIASWTLDARSP